MPLPISVKDIAKDKLLNKDGGHLVMTSLGIHEQIYNEREHSGDQFLSTVHTTWYTVYPVNEQKL